MRFGTFLDGVADEAEVIVFRPDGRDYNVIVCKNTKINLDWADKHQERFIKYVCRVTDYNLLCYDVELYPEGAPEGEVRFEEYESKYTAMI